jgi:hypothetical protein
MMLYAEKAKPRLIEKGHIVSVLLEKTGQKHIKINLDMPLCPLSQHSANNSKQ